jgi:hypothetical protein
MNKSVMAFFLSLSLTSFQAYGQRCLPGQQALQITAGGVDGFNIEAKSPCFAFQTGIAFSQYEKNGERWLFGAEYLQKQYPYKNIALPQAQFTLETGYFLNFFSDVSKTFFLSIGASALGGYQRVNWNKKLLFDGATINNRDGFIYGGALTLEPEVFLSNSLVLLCNVCERVLLGSSTGRYDTQFSLGIKYIIN